MENHHHHHHHQHAIFVQQFTFLWFFFSFVLGENSFFFHVHIPLAPRCVRDDNFPRLSAGWGRSSSNQASMVSLLIMHGDVARFSLSSSICVKDRWKFFFPFIFPHRREERKKEFFISFMSTLFLLGTFPHFVWPIINIRFLFSTRRHTQ